MYRHSQAGSDARAYDGRSSGAGGRACIPRRALRGGLRLAAAPTSKDPTQEGRGVDATDRCPRSDYVSAGRR